VVTCSVRVQPFDDAPQFTFPCGQPATVQICVGCRHEHIGSYPFCAEHAEVTLEMGGSACCYECANQEKYFAVTCGIPVEAGPHLCPQMAWPDPAGLPPDPEPDAWWKPLDGGDWKPLGWTTGEGLITS
jgi:hypothetical protein